MPPLRPASVDRHPTIAIERAAAGILALRTHRDARVVPTRRLRWPIDEGLGHGLALGGMAFVDHPVAGGTPRRGGRWMGDRSGRGFGERKESVR